MFTSKYFSFMLLLFFESGLSVTFKSENQTAEFLWNLSNFALQSRQNQKRHPYPYSYKYSGKYPQYYQKYPVNSYAQYPGSTYPAPYHESYFSHQKPPYPYDFPKPALHSIRPFGQSLDITRQSFMDVLFSIARNDDLQCVPKIICEVTSGTLSGRQQGVNLPININMESLLGFFSAINGLQSSPLLYFGKAALQGYSSKGNTGSCSYAYPSCPSDPDRLIEYLNNHNGGFFRYFNGVRPQSYPLQHQHHIYSPSFKRKRIAEQRIQNNPVNYISNNFRQQKEIKFPAGGDEDLTPSSGQPQLKFPTEEELYNNEVNPNVDDDFLYKHQSGLRFPNDDFIDNFREQPFRKPKKLPYYHSDTEFDLQKPLPNHKATPLIFPVRTGTGDLRLDAEDLKDYKEPVSYEDDDLKITFNGFNNGEFNDQIRYTNNLKIPDYERDGRGFAFPSR